MRILGIDPGTIAMGYGVIESSGDNITLIDCGTLTAPVRSPIGERLSYLYNHLLEIVSRHRPDVMAVEQPFVGKNVKSALAIGRAQAVAILVAAGNGPDDRPKQYRQIRIGRQRHLARHQAGLFDSQLDLITGAHAQPLGKRRVEGDALGPAAPE